MSGSEITIDAADGSGGFSAYLATPPGGEGPGVVVIQEIFGVNQVMRDLTDMLAAQGYTAICPDIFWRIEPGIQLTDQTKAEWDRAFELYQAFDVAKGMDDIQATMAAIRNHQACSGTVGAVGFCLGGFLAYLSATRTDCDAAVGYYGVSIESQLDEAANMTKPLMLHIAEEDGFCPKEAQEKLHAGLDANPLVTLHSYVGMDHAFAREGGEHYDAEAAGTAHTRTLDFFRANLG
jgi:carboxymethylenebutenolidase